MKDSFCFEDSIDDTHEKLHVSIRPLLEEAHFRVRGSLPFPDSLFRRVFNRRDARCTLAQRKVRL